MFWNNYISRCLCPSLEMRGKLFQIIIAAAAVVVFCGQTIQARASGWESSEQLSPSDFGISKYVISAAPGPKKVFVLRTTVAINGKDNSVYETIAYSNGATVKFKALLLQMGFFPGLTSGKVLPEAKLLLPGQGWAGDGWVLIDGSISDNSLIYNFKKANGDNIKVSCVGSIQSYAEAKARVPQLLPLPVKGDDKPHVKTWTCGAILQPEQ